MIHSLPDPEPEIERPQPRSPWSGVDLIAFGIFFGATTVFVPAAIVRIWRISDPNLRLTQLTALDQVLLQGMIDLALVGFIAFLIKVVHREGFLETIHWFSNHNFSTRSLIATGAVLAIIVMLVSALFPPSQTPPIEKLLSSPTAAYTLAIFGILLAPLFEEIIFRGFLFKVLSDMKSPSVAILVTAVLFASLHIFQLWGSWAGIVLIFVVGYILAFVRHRSNSLIPSFIIHTSYNAMLFAVFALSTFVEKGTH